jgi:hypothetical protein
MHLTNSIAAFLLLLLSEVFMIKSEDSVIKSTTTRLSESVEITCLSPSPWFFCVWEGPRGDRVCSLRSNIGKGDGSMCGGNDRMKIKGMQN